MSWADAEPWVDFLRDYSFSPPAFLFWSLMLLVVCVHVQTEPSGFRNPKFGRQTVLFWHFEITFFLLFLPHFSVSSSFHLCFFFLWIFFFPSSASPSRPSLLHPSSQPVSLAVIVPLCQPGDTAVLASSYIHALKISTQPVAQSAPMSLMLTCLAVSVWHATVQRNNLAASWIMALGDEHVGLVILFFPCIVIYNMLTCEEMIMQRFSLFFGYKRFVCHISLYSI